MYTAFTQTLQFSTEQKKVSVWDADNKENINPNRMSCSKTQQTAIFQTLEDNGNSVQTLAYAAGHPFRQSSQKQPSRSAAMSSLNKISLLRTSNQPQTSHMKSSGTQSLFPDQDIFPPFDYRKCVRCGLNDILSPKFCKYQTLSAQTDMNNMVSLTNKDRVSETHSYKNKEDDSKEQNSMLFFKKLGGERPEPTKEMATQTVIGLSEARSMRKGNLVDYKHIDKALLSPKDYK